MGTAQVPGLEMIFFFFFTTFQGLEFDGYLYVKIPEILLSLLVRFVNRQERSYKLQFKEGVGTIFSRKFLWLYSS